MAFNSKVDFELLYDRLCKAISENKRLTFISLNKERHWEHIIALGRKTVEIATPKSSGSEVLYHNVLSAYCGLVQKIVNCTRTHLVFDSTFPETHPHDRSRVVPVTFEYTGDRFGVVDGGVTGFESYNADDLNWTQMCEYGLCLCAGTRGRWDRLMLEPKEAKEVYEWITTFSILK